MIALRRPPRGGDPRHAVVAYLFIAPLLVLTGAFVLYPLIETIRLTFFHYRFIHDESAFAGLANYAAWARDPRTWESLATTARFFLIYVPLVVVVALVAALCIDRLVERRFATLYRTVLYFPVVLPAAIVYQMWIFLYDPSVGLVGQLLSLVGVQHPPDWLGDPALALPAIALMDVWQLMGQTLILFLVGLANIPREVLDAARVDGASDLQIVRRVTLPLLKPIFLLVIVLRLQALGVAVEPLYMTQGGPITATMTYGLRAYYVAFRDDQIGYASTWFLMLGVISVILAMLAWRALREQRA